jgi:hypothetical protein
MLKAFMQDSLAAAAIVLAWMIILPLGAAAASYVGVQHSIQGTSSGWQFVKSLVTVWVMHSG